VNRPHNRRENCGEEASHSYDGRPVTEFGDPNLLALQGGMLITNSADGGRLGDIGVSGLAAEEDEAIA
jgi:uncharacterized protein GlcG (DUF336 family)